MSKYDEILSADEQDRQRQAASAESVAKRYNPDQYAQAIQTGERLGIAAATVANNPEAFNRPSKYDQLLGQQDAPTTQQWLTTFDNAAVAQDDRENLTKLERAMRLIRKGYDFNDRMSQTGRDLRSAFASDFVSTPGMATAGIGRLYEAGGRYLERGVRAAGGDAAARALGADVQVPWWLSPAEILKQPGRVIKEAGASIDVPEERQNLATDVAGGLGQLTSQTLTQILTGGVSSTATLLGQGADIMGDRADEAGATPEQTDAAVLIGASITALTERYGLDALLNRLPPQIKNTFLRKLTDAAVGGGIEAAQEAVEGVLHNLTAKAIFDPDAPIFEGIEREALAAGGSGAIARAILNAAIPGRSVSFADQDRQAAEQIATIAQQSKLAARSPQKLEELVSAIKAETGSEFAYIDAEAFRTLYQTEQEAAQVAAELTGSSTTYFEAAVSNSKLAIPIEKYVSRIASNKSAQSLLDHVTFTPDGLTAAEAKVERELLEGRAKEIADKEVAEVRPDNSQAIYDDALGQLLASGMERSTAEKNAALTQVVFRTLGQRTGMDATDLYNRYGLKIQREMTGLAPGRVEAAIDPLLDRIRSGDIPSEQQAFGPSLLEFIRSKGGLQDEGGELAARDIDKGGKAFQRNIIQQDGRTLDDMAETLVEAGYLKERDPNALLDLISRELSGSPVYALGAQDVGKASQRSQIQWIEELLSRSGIDIKTADNETIKKALNLGDRGRSLDYLPTRDELAEEGLSTVDDAFDTAMVARAASIDEGLVERLAAQYADDDTGFIAAIREFLNEQDAATSEGSQESAGSQEITRFNQDGSLNTAGNEADQDRLRTVAGTKPAAGWSSATRIRGKSGRPLRIFRGSQKALDAQDFTDEALGKATGHPSSGLGVFFTTDQEDASRYGEVAGAFIDIRKPKVLKIEDVPAFDSIEDAIAWREKQKKAGFDGLVISSSHLGGPNWVVAFDANQVIPEQMVLFQIPPNVARMIDIETQLPTDEIFVEAVANTPGAQIEADGLLLDLVRFQKEEQGGSTSVRTGVFYLPTGSASAKHYKTGKNGYGGTVKIEGETLLRRPLVVKGATGGKAPEAAFDQIRGKKAYQKMRDDVLRVVLGWNVSRAEKVDRTGEVLDKYGADASMAYEIVVNSEGGNTLPYAIQENIVAHAVREAGYDSVVGYSKGKTGPFISEVFDVREVDYPTQEGDFALHPDFGMRANQRFNETKRGAIQFGADRQFTISLLEKADLSTYLHESGHFYLEILADLAEDPDAPQQIKDDFAKVLKWMKVKTRAEIGVEQHEQWARGFEAYLMEGKSPSVELQSVFARFRAWLVSVYKTLSRLNVELTDDVRGVMDRLVATDEEIQAAEESQNYAPIFTSAEQAGMSPEEWAAYQNIAVRAHEEAIEDMTDRAMKELTREQKAWWKEERAKMVETVTAEVNAMPVYRAIAFLQKGKNADGSDLPEGVQAQKLNKAALVDRYGKDFLKRLPRGLTAKEGINADLAAQMLEFDSGDALVEALANARPKAQLIEMEADARMREQYGNMLTDGSITEVAMKSVHTDDRAKVMAAELKALNRKRREVQPFVRAAQKQAARERAEAREANAATLPAADELKAIKAAVQRIIQTKKVREIQPNLYRIAEAKAARKAFELAGKGKFEEAYIEKRRQILNHELYRAAVKAREEVGSIVDYMRTFDKKAARERLGKAGGQYLEQIDSIRERFDFSNVSNIADLKRTALAEWVAEQRAKGLEVAIPDHVLNEAKRTPYKELLLAELQGLHDAVKNIDHLSRLKNKLLASAAKRDFDETVASVVESIDSNHERTAEAVDFAPRFGQKLKKGVKRYFAEHTKMEFLFSWLDGEKDLGATWDALFKPIADAENIEQAKMRDARAELSKTLSAYSKSELSGMFTRKVYVPEVKASFTRASLLSVALNSGNEYNREVLLRGYGWNESQLNSILAKLDNRDWDTVEAIWTHVDSFWPEVSDLQKDLTGLPPEKVEAMSFLTPSGRQVRGGYYPLKYDSDSSERQNQQDEAQNVSEMFGGNFARIATRQGHTKARTDSGGKKVKLDLGVYTEHVTNVIHDLAFRRAVLDVDRLIQDSRVEQAIIETAGREMYRQLRPWLRNIAADYRQPMNTVEKILNHARAGASIVSMGFKITTAVVQPLGYLQSVEMLGAKYAGIGLKEFYGRGTPQSMARAKDFVFERSEQMRNRMTTFDRDVRDQLKGLQDRSSKIRRSFFFMTGAMDMAVSLPTWLGAYRKAMDGAVDGIDAGNEFAAIDFADSTVRKSQSAGGAKDIAGIQAGHPLFKLFTTFYSYFNVMYNLMARRIGATKSAADIPQLAASAMLLWFLPAILGELIAQRGPDDDEDWGEWFASNWHIWGFYPLQGLIGFRELVQAMGPFGYDGPPALDAISQTGRALTIPVKAADDEQEVTRADVKAAVLATSYWGHLPGRQAWITGEYLYDYMTGEVEEFSVRDALFARPRD